MFEFQANLVTIRELKMGAENMKNAGKLANFTRALTKAFAVLQSVIFFFYLIPTNLIKMAKARNLF